MATPSFLRSFTILFLCLNLGLLSTNDTLAQTSKWILTEYDEKAKICSKYDGSTCFELSCAIGNKLDFAILGLPAGAGTILVDRQPVATGTFNDVRGASRILVDMRKDSSVLQAMKQGRQIVVQIGNVSAGFSLSGSSKAISNLSAACVKKAKSGATLIQQSNSYNRYVDEATMDFLAGSPTEGEFKSTQNTDLPGYDIRNGLNEEELNGLSLSQCEALCLAEDGCTAVTLNVDRGERDKGVCFLKANPQRLTGFRGAISSQMVGRWNSLPPPPTKGPIATIDESVSWKSNDTKDSYMQRVRDASKIYANSCEAEQIALDKLVGDLEFFTDDNPIKASDAYSVRWTGNTLTERIPVWIMVSSEDPVRFVGKGFFALGSDATNPFGISAGEGATRALTALWSRGAGKSGQFKVIPLKAGKLHIKIKVVGLLRKCDREVVLHEQSKTIKVESADPQPVIGTSLSRSAFTHLFELPKFNRQIEFNENRLRLSANKGSVEILERGGSGLNVSPDHRFIALVENNKFDIIDVVDGVVVSTLPIGELGWSNGASFVYSFSAPWAEVNIASLYSGQKLVSEQVTGPSCCAPSPESTRVGIDLENALFSVRGFFGHSIGSLQNPLFRNAEKPRGAYSSESIGSKALDRAVATSIGPVSPISVGNGFDFSGGLVSTFLLDDWSFSEEGVNRLFITKNKQLEILGRSKVQVKKIPKDNVISNDIRAIFNLSRLGVSVREMDLADVVVSERPEISEEHSHDKKSKEYYGRAISLANASKERTTRFGDELRKFKRQFNWSDEYVGLTEFNTECYHMDLNQDYREKDKRSVVVRTLDRLLRIPTDSGPVWISQAWCTAGATYGSLRPTSALYIHDLSHQPPPNRVDNFRETAFFFENDPSPLWIDNAMMAKGDDEYILLYAVEGSRAAVYDRSRMKVIQSFIDLPNGDLLKEVFLSTDDLNLVQLNSDGNIYVHNLADKRIRLYGRIVEDEIAVWTGDFRFDATAEAASFVDLRFPGVDEQFSFDRFDAALRTPSLAEKVLSGESIFRTRDVSIPPKLSAQIKLVNDQTIQVGIVLNKDRPADTINVYQDGALTGTWKTVGLTQEISVTRLKGARWISVIARSDEGLASNQIVKDLGGDERGSTSLKSVLVAVDIYDDERLIDLNYAKSDAGRVYDALSSLSNSNEKPTVLTKAKASSESILNAIDQLVSNTKEGDHGILFFAGHGLQDSNGKFYFALRKTDVNNLEETALSWDEVAKRLAVAKGRITVLLDACHSGAADSGAFATNDDAVSGLLSIPANITIISASKGREFSYESSEIGGGAFTEGISRVLFSDKLKYDVNQNGAIERSEFYNGIKNVVSEFPEAKQTPWMTNSRLVGDYALF